MELVLSNEIDPLKHKASVKDGILIITLFKKVTDRLWELLEAVGDKAELNAIKDESNQRLQSLNEELASKRIDRKVADERHAVRKQMTLDEMERNRVENLKLEEKQAAEKDIYRTFSEMSVQKDNNVSKPTTNTVSLEDKKQNLVVEKGNKHNDRINIASDIKESNKIIFDEFDAMIDMDDIDDSIDQTIINKQEKVEAMYDEVEEEIKFIPPPRSNGLTNCVETFHLSEQNNFLLVYHGIATKMTNLTWTRGQIDGGSFPS